MLTPTMGPDSLGKEDFLLLLVTQLQHQDPLEPLDAQDFASQLAQFTALEQQIETNELLAEQVELRAAEMIESQNNIAIGLIGAGVVASGDRVEMTGTDSDHAYVSTTGPASLRVTLTSEAGQVVLAMDTVVPTDGTHRIDFGDAAEAIEAGTYALSVELNATRDGLQATPLSNGTVSGVRWGDAGPVLVVGDQEIPLSDILQITQPNRENPS